MIKIDTVIDGETLSTEMSECYLDFYTKVYLNTGSRLDEALMLDFYYLIITELNDKNP